MPILDRSDPWQVARYELFLAHSPFTHPMQTLAWTRVKSNWRSAQVYLEEQGRIVAAMSILFRRAAGPFTIAYAPRGPVCDPNNLDRLQRLLAEAKPLLRRHRAIFLRMDPEIAASDTLRQCYEAVGLRVRGEGDAMDLIQPQRQMILSLAGKSAASLRQGYSPKARYNLGLARRRGVTVEQSFSPQALVGFYLLYQETCARDGLSARPVAYFERMMEAFGPDHLSFFTTYYRGEALSSAIYIRYGRRAWYAYGASGNRQRNLMPNYLMQQAMIEQALDDDMDSYNFGGVGAFSKDNGLYRFKEGFCRAQGGTLLIGELDLVRHRLLYALFNRLMPRLRRRRIERNRLPAAEEPDPCQPLSRAQ